MRLNNGQVLAAAAEERLVSVVSAPGSGKTTVAAERYGYQRYLRGDLRGVLGLTFNRSAAAELLRRIESRWGEGCVKPAHRVTTFDHLHIDLLTHMLQTGKIEWPNGVKALEVRDDYRGIKGFRFLEAGSYVRAAGLDSRRRVVSNSRRVSKPETGIGGVADHTAVLTSGIVSHDDVRAVLGSSMKIESLQRAASTWLSANYRALIIDEVYDADGLDVLVAYLAAEADLSVTLIGDPWQALYKWRGARPEVVEKLLNATTDRFVVFEQPESFRFHGDQMPTLAAHLRSGLGVELPEVSSADIDVALARNWTKLWVVGDNVLPLSFRTVNNATDASLNLLLDVVTRSRLGMASYGREGAIAKLGLDRDRFQAEQDAIFGPLLADLRNGKPATEVLEALREAIKSFGVRRPSRLSGDKEAIILSQIDRLRIRLVQDALVPGLTVFQAKGREWERVGVALSRSQTEMLAAGLGELDEEHCIIYVAVTRAKRACGRLPDPTDPDDLALQLEI